MHLHFLVAEGGMVKAGVFHKIPRIDDSRLAEIFSREVLAMLVRKALLSPEWAERILSWPHSGFNVHSLVQAKTKPEAEVDLRARFSRLLTSPSGRGYSSTMDWGASSMPGRGNQLEQGSSLGQKVPEMSF